MAQGTVKDTFRLFNRIYDMLILQWFDNTIEEKEKKLIDLQSIYGITALKGAHF